jgi:ATP phosphoribosyltransferase regulatory subunit
MAYTTPSGFRDVINGEAVTRERINRKVQDLFATHGFEPVETPTLEAAATVSAGGCMPGSSFKFFDAKGDLLVMRPDVTVQIARMFGTRMRSGNALTGYGASSAGNTLSSDASQNLVLCDLGVASSSKEADSAGLGARFRYTQRVFRESRGTDAQSREITQIGVECVGESGAASDAELTSLFLEALRLAGVKDVVLALATVSPLRSLLERSGARADWVSRVLEAYHTSDFVELDSLCDFSAPECDYAGIAPAYASAVKDLARIRGGFEAIENARQLLAPLGCDEGLDDLAAVYKALEDSPRCGASGLLVDFSAVSSFDYYTGLVFEAYSPYLGSPLGSGGRYDKMLARFGVDMPAAGFAFYLEQAMAASAAQDAIESSDSDALPSANKKLRIAVPKGSLNEGSIAVLEAAGLDVSGLDNPGRQLIISTDSADYIIVRPTDAPAFVAAGAADAGICGRDSLLESGVDVVELVDLKFGDCRFVVAEPAGAHAAVQERYAKLGSIRVATKYPNITLSHFAKTGMEVDILKLHGNIELAPLTGLAEAIVDITATGTTLRENNLVVVDEVLGSTARFFANPCALRTNPRIIDLARTLAANAAAECL